MAKVLVGAAVAAGSFSAAAGLIEEPQLQQFTLVGGCDQYMTANFVKQGISKNHAPYYKATGYDLYMYWDPDCDGSTNGIPRWILDRDAPHQDMSNDLDDDGLCEYLARVDSEDRNRPPAEATWTMTCNGELVQRVLTMGTTTTTSTRTKTTTTAGASTSMTHLGEVETFSMHGACDEKAFLNGAVFEAAGATRDGRPFYKARGQETYIYYDADCDGNGTTHSARWLVDDTRPSTTASMDLDQDGQCQYHARIESDDPHPPRDEVWNVYCGGVSGWSEIELTLHEEGHVPPTAAPKKTIVSSAFAGASPALATMALVLARALALV